MKKNHMLLLLCFLITSISFGQIKVGQPVGNIPIPGLLNAESKISDISQLKGRVVWLEFWATWCSPCVEAMPHLEELQKAYDGKLQVIAVSMEKEKRVQQFLANRPSNLWFAVDSADSFRKPFPYRVIPHAVLIDAKGIVVAITEPQNITKQVIGDVLAGKKINLPLKEDNLTDDPWSTYFGAADTIKSRFTLQPKIEGLPSGSKTYRQDSIFKNRRITMMNVTLGLAYRIAYGDLPYGRIIDLTDNETEKETMYCIDLIVPKGRENELMPTLRKELQARFDLKATVEKRLRPVYALCIADSNKVRMLKVSNLKEEDFSGGRGTFTGDGVRLSKIADYLEGFGLVNMPVVDETNDPDRYNIAFTYQAEKKGDLEQVLANLGLRLKKQEREIDMLIFR